MHKATFLFGSMSILLAFGIGMVVSKIIQESHITIPLSGGSSIVLGLGDGGEEPQDGTFQAESALLFNTETNTIVFQQNAFERRPLASITKLMTAMVALDHGIDFDKEANILPDEYGAGGQLVLHSGETVTMGDLFNASLLGSANNATEAYVRQLGISEEEFVQEMNRKAIALNLEQTEFFDVTGLNPKNVSTAYEVATLAHHAFTTYPQISKATSAKEYSFVVRGSGREHTIHNTNKLVVDNQIEVSGSKTGFLYEAGYCLVVQGTGAQKDRIAVVMNDISEDAQFAEIYRLLKMQVK
jgi:D-alanyl-D-alanine carboxypeptidase